MKTGIMKAVVMAAAAMLVWAGTGCQKENAPPAAVKIGVLFPLTGELAATGEDNKNGVILAAEEINASGGVKALGGARIELVFGDTQGSREEGVREAVRLIEQENVAAIIGVYNSSVATVVTQVAEQAQTPMVLNTGIADVITERGFHYTFRVIPKAEFYGRDQVRFLLDLQLLAGHPVKKVALLHENTAFGASSAMAQKKALLNNGLEMVAEVSYQSEGPTDLSQEVRHVLDAQPDAILMTTYLHDSILIAKALAAAGAAAPVIGTAGGAISAKFREKLGPLAEGIFSVSEYSPYFPAGKALNERFERRFNAAITGDSALSYQSMLVIRDALERAGSTNRQALRDALAATDLPFGPDMILPAKRLHFDASGQNASANLFIVQIQEGKLLPVWPPEFATAQPRIRREG